MEKKIAIIIWLQLILVAMFCSCGNRMSQKEKTDSDTMKIQCVLSQQDTIGCVMENERPLLPPKIIYAELEGVYDILDNGFQYLEDSLKNILFNLTVSFCGDTIIINGNEKATFTRYTVATKDLYRQYSHCQRAILKYFEKRTINVSDSIDYLSLSNYMNLDGFTYTFPGIIYERPYLIIPFEMNYMASFIVDIEPTENNRIMPERRKR